ncbi:MAG: glycosyltransferase [Lachnospiraceae bacterium]|nr:glycosyltransferase [Lachnospiraceae bacterium]
MKKILMYRWKAYNYLDIKEGFIKLGYQVDEIRQELESYDVDREFSERIAALIRSNTYEFVFTVNYFALISEVCEQNNILYVSWSCDNPLISMYHNSVFNKCNLICVFDKTNYLEFKQMGVDNIRYLPLAVDASRISHIINGASDLNAYENDISFVGSLYERNSYDRIEHSLPDYLRGYFDAIMNIQSDLYGAYIIDDALSPDILMQLEKYYRLDKSPGSFSSLSLIFKTTTLGFKIAQIARKRALLTLSKTMPVSIYSNSDTSDLVNVAYKGSLDYWTEMPKVFYKSKINLNLTIPNIKSGIPLRIWDILGSGGFLLTNYQAELPLYFEDGVHLVSFYSSEDMAEKADFYLKHEDSRKKNSPIRERHRS